MPGQRRSTMMKTDNFLSYISTYGLSDAKRRIQCSHRGPVTISFLDRRKCSHNWRRRILMEHFALQLCQAQTRALAAKFDA